ncbi:hypothetical protein OOK06_36795 [Streptomyces sp. NBC_00340]|uniref:hypothetical protein n=1 Tax=Streptomyces sp. NBC_00340 TaxID=2975716 RepID=UPI002255E441|nr:hypothetical protein [Streptomyces sp. NBC_00340]MCX5137630.1 hypothetical protein [Streptomyces sp. NBC_00340]
MTTAFAVLAPVGSWLLDHEWILQAAFWLLVASVLGLLLLAAWGIVRAGRRAGHAIAIRWQARELARWAEGYANHPGVRQATDYLNQPRKEEL